MERMRKRDFILIGLLILFVISLFFCFIFRGKNKKYAYIYHKDELIKVVDLSVDDEFKILDENMTIIVKGGKIGVADSSCENKVCINMGMSNSTPIICAINNVTITFDNTSKDVIVG